MKLLLKTLAAAVCIYSPLTSATAASTVKVHPLQAQEDHWGDYTSWSLRDSEEFLWIASDNGLKRYDGYDYRVYRKDDPAPGSIGSEAIRHLMLLSDGSFWANGATLNKYDPKTDSFTSYSVTGNRAILGAYEDNDGLLWLVGEGFGLIRFDPVEGAVVGEFLQGDGKQHIWRIVPRANTPQLWLASTGGLLLFDRDTREVKRVELPIDMSTGPTSVRGIDEDDQGHLWIATGEGLFVLDPDVGIIERFVAEPGTPGSLGTNKLWAIKVDSHGQVWVGTDKQGVYKYQPPNQPSALDQPRQQGEFRHFPASAFDAYRFPPGTVTHINEDAKGNLWFSFGAFGVYRLSEHLEKFEAYRHSFDTDNSLSFNNVLDLLEDSRGDIWIATDGGGLDRFNPRTHDFAHYRHNPDAPQSLSTNDVVALAEDSRGYIWAGTWDGGLNRLDPETGEVLRLTRNPDAGHQQTLAGDSIFRIVVDSEDRLLLSIWGEGLQIYDPRSNTFDTFLAAPSDGAVGLLNESITDILPATDGDYFLAGYHGLERFSPDTGQSQKLDFPIPADISDLHMDDEGFLWAATNKGLIRFNPVSGAREILTSKNGLSDDFVVSIQPDASGFLWVGSSDGLNRLDPRTREIITFDEHDGLASRQFNRFSHLKSRDGTLYFGGTNGFTRFDPTNLPVNEHAPVIHITAVELGQLPLKPGDLALKTVPNYADQLVLPNDHRDIAFNFTATNFVTPVRNQFRYRLKGLEEDWIEGDSTRRRAQYNNLEPGDYIFQVIAANNDGVWAGSAKAIAVTVRPGWWQTWWAQGAYVLTALLAAYGFSQWRVQANRKRAKRLQTLVAQQTGKLKKANHAISQLNSELEQRVEHRTRELHKEIEERKDSEAKANYIAYHDGLTGLYNRPWLLNHLQQLIDDRTDFALLFVAGDRFRKINDIYGHLQGDKLLKASAERLLNALPKESHSVRLGSDEFVVVIDKADNSDHIGRLADNIVQAFKEPFIIDRVRMNLGVSVGYVISQSCYNDPAQVLRDANIAMQRAKDRGRGISQLFDGEILREVLDTTALEADLKQALKREQFSVVFQPIIVLESGDLNGFEVLIRWQHPERGFVPPDKFISMAESSGLIADIGLWVLEKACEQLRQWRDELGLTVLPSIAVNLSPVQLEHADLPLRVDEIFQRTGVGRENIKFEITETALMKHTDTVDGMLDALRERGIELAIDDFGTGYSSLSYLDKLPVQVLKIDRSFVDALTDVNKTTSSHEIVRATISLAHNLKMRVVAEGIETQEQMDILQTAQCDYGQGYFIARPLSPEAATELLARSRITRLPESPV